VKEVKTMAMYRHRFQVTGFGSFPLDMLRYDGCYPATSEDAGLIQEHLDRNISMADRDKTPITLTHINGQAKWAPTAGRWESFLWKVVRIEHPDKL
jgi:hypothetical protein